jgi:hypothetical protein
MPAVRTISDIDRSGSNDHKGRAMTRSFATISYYYPDEVGTG